MKKSINLLVILFALIIQFPALVANANEITQRDFYQLIEYRFSTKDQEKIIDDYLKQAYIPGLHKAGVTKKIGVFKPIVNDTSLVKKIFVLIPLSSLDLIVRVQQKLDNDKDYLNAATAYHKALHSSPPYSRMITTLLQAFSDAPTLQQASLKGPGPERIYELRSYESATEALYRNKVRMFNEGGEVKLFKRLNFNAVFYGEVVAGDVMPNLVYMTSFENIADREAHWKTFVDDPEWKKLSAMPEYQHNVSHIDITLLHPAEYSEL